ncbi:MAG: hypothetical protein AAF328_01760 [Planctomycetota bacterium]
MILNLLIIGFVVGMGVLWATYGLFSALIHLAMAIAAGAIAFAVWEPVTVNFLLPYLPHYAWAVGLILPFALALLLLRIGADKLVTGNMKFPGLVDQICGGLVGAASGVISAGVLVIGLSFLPMPLAFLQFQPYEVKANGTVGPYEGTDNAASLWIPADQVVATLFSELSLRGFSSSRPMAEVQPDVLQTAGTFRLGRFYDEHATLVAQPDTLNVEWTVTHDGELPDGVSGEMAQWLTTDATTRAGDRFVVVNTTWQNEPRGKNATFDDDDLLRIPPYQAQLVADSGGKLERYLPVGWTKPSDFVAGREFWKVETNQSMASSLVAPAEIAFVYAIPESSEPAFIELRNVRLELDESVLPEGDSPLLTALGSPAGEAVVEDAGPVENPQSAEAIGEKQGGFANHQPVGLEQSPSLPRAISPNDATGLDIRDGFVVGGKDSTDKPGGSASAREIGIPDSLRPIRIQITPLSAAGQVGLGAGSSEADIWLEAANGNKFIAIGYAWQSGRVQEIAVQPIERTTDLPLNQLKEGDNLYLYFQVPPNIPLARYHVGDQTYFEIDWTVDPDAGKPRARRR